MKVTKKSVIIETTNTVNGMLEQGGISGRIMAYPIAAAAKACGLTVEQLRVADLGDDAPSYKYQTTICEAIERECAGRCIRRGSVIQ